MKTLKACNFKMKTDTHMSIEKSHILMSFFQVQLSNLCDDVTLKASIVLNSWVRNKFFGLFSFQSNIQKFNFEDSNTSSLGYIVK